MNYLGKFLSNFKDLYNEINPATLTGAIDVIVAQQEDGTYLTSPFHVRFGKIGVLKSKEKIVDIEINGQPVDIHMKLGESGEAFFVEPVAADEELSSAELATSPLPQTTFQPPDFHTLPVDGRQLDVNETIVVDGEPAAGAPTPVPDGAADRGALQRSADVGDSGDRSMAEEGSSGAGSALPTGAVVTFRAQKVEKLVKLDGSTMFVPIKNTEKISTWTQTEAGEAAVAEPDPHYSSSSNGSLIETRTTAGSGAVEPGPSGGGKQKRKQKKRKQKHRRSMSETKEVTTVTTVEDCIFTMEDVVQGVHSAVEDRSSMTTSVSTPTMSQYCHPFSDTDLSPVGSPRSSRTPTPIKSDTEFEIERERLVSDEGSQTDTTVWQWGELPSPAGHSPAASADASAPVTPAEATGAATAEQRSVLSGMFSFMRKTKKARHNPVSEGIYLDDLNLDALDPEVAALYFPKSQMHHYQHEDKDSSVAVDSGGYHDEDEGNGSSIPHSPSPSSPHSADGGVGGRQLYLELERQLGDVAMSLCGGLDACQDADIPESMFLQCLVTYDDLCDDPRLLERPELVVRVAGRYYNWPTAAPMLCSGVMFGRPLPERAVALLADQLMPKKKPAKKGAAGRTYSWWSWRRSSDTAAAAAGEGVPEGATERVDGAEQAALADLTPPVATNTAQTQTGTPPGTPGRVRSDATGGAATESPRVSESETTRHSESDEAADDEVARSGQQRYKKTLRLSSEQIERLGLHEGQNEAMFSVTTAYQGTSRCTCSIFLWRYDDKIVVSDIDGTITRSDVLGHILPIVGQNWAQSGVAALFTKIQANGYKFLYLSARSIGHAPITRDYLRSVRQGELKLPDGPLLLSPSSLISALHREVIEKRPEDFKIPCLRDICGLFPGRTPLYAGYGNRVNDAFSYRAVGIPNSRIFTINHRGELRHELTQTFQSSYQCQSFEVDKVFPTLYRRLDSTERFEETTEADWEAPVRHASAPERFYSVDAGDPQLWSSLAQLKRLQSTPLVVPRPGSPAGTST